MDAEPLRRRYFELVLADGRDVVVFREPAEPPDAAAGSSSGREQMTYVELHCHSAYSFLDGASCPRSSRSRAAELGYAALRAHRPRRRLGGDGVRAGLQGRSACGRSSAPS